MEHHNHMHHQMNSMDHQMNSSNSNDHLHAHHGHEHSQHHGMMMFFHNGFNETILFEFWKISSINGLIWSMVGVMIMAALYEGLKYYREQLLWKTYHVQSQTVSLPTEQNVPSKDHRVIHRLAMFSWAHVFQTFLHIIQVVISYLLMLIFMTYNTWLCIAIAIGAAIGYFVFGWKKSVIVDITEHCH